MNKGYQAGVDCGRGQERTVVTVMSRRSAAGLLPAPGAAGRYWEIAMTTYAVTGLVIVAAALIMGVEISLDEAQLWAGNIQMSDAREVALERKNAKAELAWTPMGVAEGAGAGVDAVGW